ncbi:DUF6049 family protein [Streptacidiphilus griseoplanus]|uniref:DUF6049 family protein n=1 Tax=Peterkaempfera griseoplana TaxID=66896 RepID=UPI0006E1C05B|nr:DUF6049 family protein [Peterkaempfera griseoplana]
MRRAAALAGACALVLFGGAVGAPAAQAGTAHTAAPAQAAAAAPRSAGAAGSGKVTPPGASKPSAAFPVALSISSVSPTYVASGSTKVTVTGTLYNGGRKPVRNAHVGLRTGVGQPLRTRSEIAALSQRTDPVTSDGLEVPGVGTTLSDLAPGARRSFKVSATASQLIQPGSRSTGVYELAVDVKGSTSAVTPLPVTLGIARTYLPYYPLPTDIRKTQIATVWPVTATPETVPQSLPGEADSLTPVLRSEQLAADMAPGGRLYEVVAAGSSLAKATWVVDGDVLDTAATMSKAYRVQHKGTEGKAATTDNTDPGTGSGQASAWLESLRTAAHGDEVVSLPYSDPDLASIAHNGSGVAGLPTALKRATTAGSVTTDYRLGTDARSDVAWPYEGHVDPQVVATARTAGGTTLLVNGTDMPESDTVTSTVNAARSIGKGLHAVVSDAPLSNIFSGALSTPQARALAVQRFLAETLTITLEQPNDQRSLLVMPPRNLSANAADTLAEAMGKATQGQWVSQATLGTVAKAPADPHADTKVPAAARYPRAARTTQLSHWALSRSMGTQGQLDLLMQILVSPDRVRDPFSAAILRSMSTAWRTDRTTAHSYREGVADYLQTLSSAVRLVDKSSTTLSGDSGMIQVSVENSLSQTVTNLEVRLTSASATRLTVYQPTPAQLSVLSELKKSVRFPAKASANGPVRMTAQLWTTGADPKPYGAPVSFDLEVTDVTSGVIWVIAGGLLLTLLAGVRIYLQRKKRGHAGPEPDPEAPASPQGRPDPDSDTVQGRPGTVEGGGGAQQDASVDGADGPEQTARNEKVGP